MFQSLIRLPKQAVFILINEKDKRVYISYSSKLHARIGEIAAQIRNKEWRWKGMIEDKKRLELKILETTVEKHFVKYYRDYYRNNGYELYNEKERVPLQYEFKINYSVRKVIVVAVDKSYNKTVLGRFETYEEARGFLFYIKHNNPAGSPVYAVNGVRK